MMSVTNGAGLIKSYFREKQYTCGYFPYVNLRFGKEISVVSISWPVQLGELKNDMLKMHILLYFVKLLYLGTKCIV